MGMVDIHSHVLPGIDDGSKSWEMTLEMCRIAIADGTTHIVATPHCNDRYPYDRGEYLAMCAELKQRVGDQLDVSLGCDFHFSYENIQEALRHPEKFTIGTTNYLLVEFSDYGISAVTTNALEQVSSTGAVPIITHPERNLILQKQPELVLKWIEIGCLVQVTANSVTGYWGPVAKKIATWLLKKDAVHVIASDAHDPLKRTPVLSGARRVAATICGDDIAGALVVQNPQAIVKGEPLPYL